MRRDGIRPRWKWILRLKESQRHPIPGLLHVTAEVTRQRLSAHNGRLPETLAARDR